MRNFIPIGFISCFLFVAHLGHSQDNSMSVGFIGGAGMCKVNLSDSAGTGALASDPAFAFAGGATFKYRFSPLFEFNSGIIFEGRSSKYSSSTSFFGFSASVEAKSKYSFLTVPLTGGLSVGDKFRFDVGTGPYFSFLLSASSRVETTTSGFSFPGFPAIPPTSTITNTDDKDNFKPIDMGLVFYTGFSVSLTEKMDFVFRAQYNLGLINTIDDPVGNESAKFNTFYGLVGMNFHL